MSLGSSLYHARKKSGLSQENVAEKLGVSRQTISKWETEGYPTGADCSVSLDGENKDSLYSPISVGDVVTVYFDGNIAESYPLQINTVYAITLTEPADRTQENQG